MTEEDVVEHPAGRPPDQPPDQPPDRLPAHLPETVIHQLTTAETIEVAVEAMITVLRDGDQRAFQRAIGLYVVAARERRRPIEDVLATLNAAAVASARIPRVTADARESATSIYAMILHSVLVAFYGEIAVSEEGGARTQRAVDAPTHTARNTWPGARHRKR